MAPRRFYGRVSLEPVRMLRDLGDIAESIVKQLGRSDAEVTITVEIEATAEGGWRFLNQAGCPYKGAYRQDAPAYTPDALRSVHDAQNLRIAPKTAATRWAGERMDYDLALFALFSQRDHKLSQRDHKRFRGNAASSTGPCN